MPAAGSRTLLETVIYHPSPAHGLFFLPTATACLSLRRTWGSICTASRVQIHPHFCWPLNWTVKILSVISRQNLNHLCAKMSRQCVSQCLILCSLISLSVGIDWAFCRSSLSLFVARLQDIFQHSVSVLWKWKHSDVPKAGMVKSGPVYKFRSAVTWRYTSFDKSLSVLRMVESSLCIVSAKGMHLVGQYTGWRAKLVAYRHCLCVIKAFQSEVWRQYLLVLSSGGSDNDRGIKVV